MSAFIFLIFFALYSHVMNESERLVKRSDLQCWGHA